MYPRSKVIFVYVGKWVAVVKHLGRTYNVASLDLEI